MDLLINYEVYVLFYLIILLMDVYFFKPVDRPNVRSGDDGDFEDDDILHTDHDNMDDETDLDDYYMPPPAEPQTQSSGTSSQTPSSITLSQTPAAGPMPSQSPRQSPVHSPASSIAPSLSRPGSGHSLGSNSDAGSMSRRTPRRRTKARPQRTDNPTISVSSSAKRQSSRGRRSCTPNTPFNRGRSRATQVRDPVQQRSSPRLAARHQLAATGESSQQRSSPSLAAIHPLAAVVAESSQPRRSPRHHPCMTGARKPGLPRTSSNTRTITAKREIKFPDI